MALLEIHDLHTFFKTKKGIVKAVNGVSYSVEPGKTLGVVGESGSGKSVSAMSILKLLDGNGYIDSGEIIFDGKNLADVSVKDMCKIRGNEISVIFQEPMTSLNPIFTVERQLSEPFIIHQGMNKKEAAEKVVEMLKDVRIPNPEAVAKQYPHQLSGGMRQRVMIAMALACRPKLLIADEPTTALDVTIQAQILKLMNDLKKKEHPFSLSHMILVLSTRWQTMSLLCTVVRLWKKLRCAAFLGITPICIRIRKDCFTLSHVLIHRPESV
jgi:peptide/nickel transport system ATP-binding protein